MCKWDLEPKEKWSTERAVRLQQCLLVQITAGILGSHHHASPRSPLHLPLISTPTVKRTRVGFTPIVSKVIWTCLRPWAKQKSESPATLNRITHHHSIVVFNWPCVCPAVLSSSLKLHVRCTNRHSQTTEDDRNRWQTTGKSTAISSIF